METPRPAVSARRLSLAAVVCSAALLGAACGDDEAANTSDEPTGASDSAPTVVATTSIWADVTSQVGCGEVEVTTLIPVGTDAHAYEPSVQDADLLSGAGLVVANGLGLEEGAIDAIETAEADGVTVIELGDQLEPIEGGHSEEAHSDEEAHSEGEAHSEEEAHSDEKAHSDEEAHSEDEAAADEEAAASEEEAHSEEEGHSHGESGMDPHVWMDPDRVAMAVPIIAEGLASMDGLPVDAEQIDACAEEYVAELTALSAELDEQFAGLTGSQRKLVTNHEALGYLADRFDLEVTGAIIPSTSSLGESNVRDIEELAATMQEQGVTRIYGEVTGSDEVSAALAEQVGSDVEIVALYTESLGDEGSGAETYLDMMRTNGSLIAEQ
jgi:ABC-type Zn uptake system ZnuABC Zn-binding protein ZnuA